MSLLIVSSIVITNVDRLLNSECGISCGYVIEKYTFFNPLDYILVQMSKYFPLDSVLFGLILFYVFVTCLYGIVRLGIKFLCFTVSIDFLSYRFIVI
jgi:LMBR1 domain-containing protein 1